MPFSLYTIPSHNPANLQFVMDWFHPIDGSKNCGTVEGSAVADSVAKPATFSGHRGPRTVCLAQCASYNGPRTVCLVQCASYSAPRTPPPFMIDQPIAAFAFLSHLLLLFTGSLFLPFFSCGFNWSFNRVLIGL